MEIVSASYGYLHLQRRNVRAYAGTCGLCRFAGDLHCYDTRFWFSVNRIPLIPLRRWHVWNKCPSCGHGQEMPLNKWDEMIGRVLNETLYVVKQDPRNRRIALKAIETALPYFGTQLCLELAGLLEQHWSEDSGILRAVADLYAANASPESVERVLRRLHVKTADPEIADSLAGLLLTQSRPAEAWEYLQTYLVEGWSEKIPLLLHVISGHQDQQLHDRAIDLLDACAKAFPEIEARSDYQACRKVSEKNRPYRARSQHA